MKKSTALVIVILVSIFLFSACDRTFSKTDKLEPTQIGTVNGLESITMTIKEETVSAAGLSVILENYSDREFVYVPLISLEVQIDDMWYQVPVLHEITYDMALSWLSPGDQKELKFNWEYEYGKLDRGKYRAVLYEQFQAVSEESAIYGGTERLILAAEFEII
jgi:hypothetical protein